MHGPGGFSKAATLVSLDCGEIIQFRVAGEFAKSLLQRPRLNESEQRLADAYSSKILRNEPAFEIRHGCGAGPLDVIGTNGGLGEAHDFAVNLGQRDHSVAIDQLGHFEFMAIRRTVGPEFAPKQRPRDEIGLLRDAYSWFQAHGGKTARRSTARQERKDLSGRSACRRPNVRDGNTPSLQTPRPPTKPQPE